ncbi:MAG: Peptidase M16 inactive domain protein [Bacteroidetes bacterium ADurb.Bin408]|nr:MAG: Peptidase M16 inactive domain protein [Bacteroidetes bacterium ADurb.Bin408]
MQIGQYQTAVLPNGLKVFIVENSKLPTITLSLLFDYDPILEKDKCGLSDITGQILKTGTTTRTKAQIDDEIDFIGASISTGATSINASSLSKHKEKLFEIVSDIIINAKFVESEFEKAKSQMLSSLAMEKNSPDAISNRLSKLLIYGKDHPYGESPTEATLNNISLKDCENLFKTYFRPNISYLAIVGDVKKEDVLPLIEKYFGKWEKAEVPKHSYKTPQTPAKTTVSIVDRPSAVQSSVTVMFPVELKPGTDDAVKARLMNAILGGSTSRLFDNLREKHGFTYGAYSSLSPDKLIGEFSASSEVRNSVTDSAITEILFEINRIIKEPVSEKEITLHRNETAGSFALSLEKPQTIASFALNIERYNLDKDFYKNYLKKLESVTINDLQQNAQKFLKPQNAHILVVGKAEEVAEKIKKFAPDGIINYYDDEGNAYDPNKKLKPAPEGLTAETVLENYLNAIGGRKNLVKVKDITKIYSTLMQGMLIEMKMYQKAPNKMYVEVGAGGMILSKQTYDGVKAVSSVPMMGETKELEGDELESLKLEAIINLELDYAKNGIKIQLLGIEDINGSEAYKVEIQSPSGKKSYDYFDTKSSLKVRSIGDSGQSNFSDYKEIKKIKYPGKITQDMEGQTIKFELKSVEVNKKLDDKLFTIE